MSKSLESLSTDQLSFLGEKVLAATKSLEKSSVMLGLSSEQMHLEASGADMTQRDEYLRASYKTAIEATACLSTALSILRVDTT